MIHLCFVKSWKEQPASKHFESQIDDAEVWLLLGKCIKATI
jgi:hypothetical protein